MTGCPLFNNIQEAYDVYERLTNYERNQFNPSGCLLSVKLSLYENNKSPYLYCMFFEGMSKNEWSLTNLVLEVGERKTPLKWSVTNHLIKHLQTDELVADEEMSKKQIFALLDKKSPGISDAIKRNFLTTEMVLLVMKIRATAKTKIQKQRRRMTVQHQEQQGIREQQQLQ
eukprot:8715170-Ditylum_brightwellii.AAC.1